MQTVITQTSIRITRKGELQYFQLRIPRGIKQVLGVETVANFATAFPALVPPATFMESFVFYPARMVGQLRLQQVGQGGLIHAGAVYEQDATQFYADYSLFPATDWSHKGKSQEDELVFTPESSIVMGFYRDVLGKRLNQHLDYIVQVYLWLQTEQISKEAAA